LRGHFLDQLLHKYTLTITTTVQLEQRMLTGNQMKTDGFEITHPSASATEKSSRDIHALTSYSTS